MITGIDYRQSQNGFLSVVEGLRLQASRNLEAKSRSKLGQYFTPLNIANLMASMAPSTTATVRILDPGAGTGILSAALINKLLSHAILPTRISITAYEIDPYLHPYLEATLNLCKKECLAVGIDFSFSILGDDFIEAGAHLVTSQKQMSFLKPATSFSEFDLVIANPPYRKISSQSTTRKILRQIGIETSNLYTAFLAVALMLTVENGHLIAITPRSFCNGLYFKPFRDILFREASFARIHLFGSREEAFNDADVLQENVIFWLIKNNLHHGQVLITSNDGPSDTGITCIELPHRFVIRDADPNKFVHIVSDELSKKVIDHLERFPCTLKDLDIQISTGRVVDFRAAKYLKMRPATNTVPLIYPANIQGRGLQWPCQKTNKPQAIVRCLETEDLLIDNGIYVLTKRFTSKEQPKRVVAILHQPDYTEYDKVGLENHLNYFHKNGKPLEKNFAVGLVTFLNSTLVDLYFRIFSGHTQVNATDLRAMKYPTAAELEELGRQIGDSLLNQDQIDTLVERNLSTMSDEVSPVSAVKRIEDAIAILKQFGLPKAQQNERSGLTLLALLDLKPNDHWRDAKSPLIGITEMMNFFETNYGKKYAPNTRETVRRFTIHQFVQAGIVIPNPDKPRPVNSPKYVYQIEPSTLKLIQEFGSQKWDTNLPKYLASLETLREKYAQTRELIRIPVEVTADIEITLSAGGQNVLIKKIWDEFCSRFTPGGRLIYLGDVEDKWAYFDEATFKQLGLGPPDEHGKIPDVIVYFSEKNWLVLIEAVTSHGPINPKRKIELEDLFKDSDAELVFVTAFLTRKDMLRYLGEIAWQTEVWVAESPDHMIHFNGERFLGPRRD
jgi:adenine-specific DNA-methyltransferase